MDFEYRIFAQRRYFPQHIISGGVGLAELQVRGAKIVGPDWTADDREGASEHGQ